MKRLALLFLSLLLLCGCAPQMGEESPLTPLDEPKSEAEGSESISEEETLPLNQKILLDFDSREEFATDSVRVTLKASASDHLDPPTKEDFPGIEISRIEYLISGGYDPEVGRDWDAYFTDRWEYDPEDPSAYATPEHDPEHFRWRLRLYFEHPSEETARAAVDVLNGMDAVAEVENAELQAVPPNPLSGLFWEQEHTDFSLYVTISQDYSDPHNPYTMSEFPDLPVQFVHNHSWPLRCSWNPNEHGINESFFRVFPSQAHKSYQPFQWEVRVHFPRSTDEELKEYVRVLEARDDVLDVSLSYVGHLAEPDESEESGNLILDR